MGDEARGYRPVVDLFGMIEREKLATASPLIRSSLDGLEWTARANAGQFSEWDLTLNAVEELSNLGDENRRALMLVIFNELVRHRLLYVAVEKFLKREGTVSMIREAVRLVQGRRRVSHAS